jgi:hypothetical protein
MIPFLDYVSSFLKNNHKCTKINTKQIETERWNGTLMNIIVNGDETPMNLPTTLPSLPKYMQEDLTNPLLIAGSFLFPFIYYYFSFIY